MSGKITSTRRMICPYCKYERDVAAGSGDIYCGPHYASFGGNSAPKILMVEKEHPGSCECADCWEAMEGNSKGPGGEQ